MRSLFLTVLAACKFHDGVLANAVVDDAPISDDTTQGPSDASMPDTPADVQQVIAPDAAIDAPPAVTVRQDCLDWYQNGVTTSGVQMIDPDGAGVDAPFQAYCDMATDGGGWTLVWVYGFTNYGGFATSGNAVTPRPTWGGNSGTPTSTTVPLSPTTQGALEFAKWPLLGANFLFESNINQWLSCTPGTGSLVTGTSGSITCTIQSVITSVCTTTAPDRVGEYNQDLGLWAGPSLVDTYDFWDGSTSANWPTHDPCGNNGANQKTGVAGPYGSIYLRR